MDILEIPKNGAAFVADFFGDKQQRDFEGGTCRLHSVPGSAAIEVEVVRIVVDLASNVGAGVVAAALYDTLTKTGVSTIRINGVETNAEKEQIEPRISAPSDQSSSDASNSSEVESDRQRKN